MSISDLSTVPDTDSVMKSVFISGPPKHRFVSDAPSGLVKIMSGSARWFSTHARPSPGLATNSRPAVSIVKPSGPLGPYDVKNCPTLLTFNQRRAADVGTRRHTCK